MKPRSVSALVLASFAAGAVFAAFANSGAPRFAVLVRGHDGKPAFMMDSTPRPDFVYIGFPVAKGPSAAPRALVEGSTGTGTAPSTPTLACPPLDKTCQHTVSASLPIDGTIICEPGECNPPTGVYNPHEQVKLTVSANVVAKGLTKVLVEGMLHDEATR